MDLFVYLAAEPGAVVSKEEILEAVWGGAFVEEGVLAQAVHSLRKALGDDARRPRFIQTIPKRGYRLVVSVAPETDTPPLTPDGKVLAEAPAWEVKALLPAPARLSRWSAWLLIGFAIFALLAFWGLTQLRSGSLRKTGKATMSIASEGRRIVVLPFEALNQPKGAYFAKGLTEEITKDLASLAALQVISRTSAMHYEGTDKRLPEIGRELNVDYVLEGSVQWDPGPESPRVRIRARLIRATDDSQIWAGAFDKEVSDIFAVQSEISRQVIAQLGIALTPEESRALRAAPTDNLDAYQAYLRGLELRNQPFYSPEHVLKAVSMFEHATEIDPHFAAAWAELSQSHSYLAFNTDRSLARVEAARKAMERAVALDPDLPSVWLARIYFSYRCKEDYDTALAQLNAAAQLFPNNTEVLKTLGFVLRRKGRLREAAEVLRNAFTLDPKEIMLLWVIGETYRAVRNYESADRFYSQAISLAPDQPVYWEGRTLNNLAWRGDLSAAREILAQAPIATDPALLSITVRLDFYARDYQTALSRISPEKLEALTVADQLQLTTLAAIARELMGDHRGAHAAAEANRTELEELVRSFPKEPYYPALLAIALAQLNRGDEACTLAEKTARENRRDAFGGPNVVEFQAMVETILGRRTEAIGRLDWLLGTPYRSAISVNELRLNPIWDPLRADPRFEELLQRYSD